MIAALPATSNTNLTTAFLGPRRVLDSGSADAIIQGARALMSVITIQIQQEILTGDASDEIHAILVALHKALTMKQVSTEQARLIMDVLFT